MHLRVFHGLTHVFVNSLTGSEVFHAVKLSELVGYLNDVAGSQPYHRDTYGHPDE